MSARVAGLLALGLTLVGTAGGWAQDPPGGQDPGKPTPEQLGVSLDRIKMGLGQSHLDVLRISPDQPTFRILVVEERRRWMPTFVETLKIPWQPIPNGGIDYYEIMKMITPPQARLYGAYNSTELVQVMATSLVSALMINGLRRAAGYLRDDYRQRHEAATRDEVRRELEEFLRAHPEAPRPIWWIGTIK